MDPSGLVVPQPRPHQGPPDPGHALAGEHRRAPGSARRRPSSRSARAPVPCSSSCPAVSSPWPTARLRPVPGRTHPFRTPPASPSAVETPPSGSASPHRRTQTPLLIHGAPCLVPVRWIRRPPSRVALRQPSPEPRRDPAPFLSLAGARCSSAPVTVCLAALSPRSPELCTRSRPQLCIEQRTSSSPARPVDRASPATARAWASSASAQPLPCTVLGPAAQIRRPAFPIHRSGQGPRVSRPQRPSSVFFLLLGQADSARVYFFS